MSDLQDLTAKERAAAVAWAMARGQQMTTADIAKDYEITRRGAARLMNELSRVIPIVRSMSGYWLDVDLIIIGTGEHDDYLQSNSDD